MKSITPTSKFKLLTTNELTTPGCCISCGTNQGEFIDFGMSVEFWGAAYFCVDVCFREAAILFGFVSPVEHDPIKMQLEYYYKENEALKDQVEEMKRVLGNLTANFASTLAYRGVLSVPSTETDQESEQSIRPTDPVTDESNSKSDGPDDESGYTDLQYNDSIDQFISSTDLNI